VTIVTVSRDSLLPLFLLRDPPPLRWFFERKYILKKIIKKKYTSKRKKRLNI
jgi:hypothetical protein